VLPKASWTGLLC